MPLTPPHDADAAVLARLCADVRFPAAKWMLIVAALDFGIDAVSLGRLHRMPDRTYLDRGDLDGVYRSTPALLPSVPPSQRRAASAARQPGPTRQPASAGPGQPRAGAGITGRTPVSSTAVSHRRR